MTSTNSVGGAGSLSAIMNQIDLGPSSSVQLMFAKLQLAQSAIAKAGAEQYMTQIQEIQDEQKAVADMISKARDLQNEAKNADSELSTMPDDMIKFFNDRGLKIENTGKDDWHKKSEWDYNIKSLTDYQQTISNDTQTLMVYLQDFMGQYNSYLQGANSAISQSTQTLTTLATGR